jgi:hypothetical protein
MRLRGATSRKRRWAQQGRALAPAHAAQRLLGRRRCNLCAPHIFATRGELRTACMRSIEKHSKRFGEELGSFPVASPELCRVREILQPTCRLHSMHLGVTHPATSVPRGLLRRQGVREGGSSRPLAPVVSVRTWGSARCRERRASSVVTRPSASRLTERQWCSALSIARVLHSQRRRVRRWCERTLCKERAIMFTFDPSIWIWPR